MTWLPDTAKAALISLALQYLAPKAAQLLAEIMQQVIDNLKADNVDEQTLADKIWPHALKTVKGIAASEHYTHWPDDQKRELARNAVTGLVRNMGGDPSDRTVNWIIESAVQFLPRTGEVSNA